MSLTRLTNTSWQLDVSPNSFPRIGMDGYALNFESNGASFNKLAFWLGTFNIPEVYYGDLNVYRQPNWQDEAYRTIDITGGDDADDPDLIQWLENFATQIANPVRDIDYLVPGSEITTVAEAIRDKRKINDAIVWPAEFVTRIREIPQFRLMAVFGSYKTATGSNNTGLSRQDYAADDFAEWFTHGDSSVNYKLTCLQDCELAFTVDIRNVSATKRNQVYSLHRVRGGVDSVVFGRSETSEPAGQAVISCEAGDYFYVTMNNGYNVGTVYVTTVSIKE